MNKQLLSIAILLALVLTGCKETAPASIEYKDVDGQPLKGQILSYTDSVSWDDDVLEVRKVEYNEQGQIVTETVKDGEGTVTETVTYHYNDQGLLIQKTIDSIDPMEPDTITYAYNDKGQLITESTHLSYPEDAFYDPDDETVEEYNRPHNYLYTYEYDGDKLVKKTCEGIHPKTGKVMYLESTTTFEYKADGSYVKSVESVFADEYEKSQYDAQGRVLKSEFNESETSFTYDPKTGLLTREDSDDGFTTTYAYQYDEQGNWTQNVSKSTYKDEEPTGVKKLTRTIQYR